MLNLGLVLIIKETPTDPNKKKTFLDELSEPFQIPLNSHSAATHNGILLLKEMIFNLICLIIIIAC